jgi:hypothetical protein
LREIARPRPNAGLVKEQLGRLSIDMIKARNTATALPERQRQKLGVTDKFIVELERVSQASWKGSDKIAVRKTGGAKAKSDRMLLAAALTRQMITTFTEVATGNRRSKGDADAERACVRHLHMIWKSKETAGIPDKPDWDRSSE